MGLSAVPLDGRARVERLYLSGCKFGDAGCYLLIDHLFKKGDEALLPNLQVLAVDGNTMGKATADELLEAGKQFRPDLEIVNEFPKFCDLPQSMVDRHNEKRSYTGSYRYRE